VLSFSSRVVACLGALPAASSSQTTNTWVQLHARKTADRGGDLPAWGSVMEGVRHRHDSRLLTETEAQQHADRRRYANASCLAAHLPVQRCTKFVRGMDGVSWGCSSQLRGEFHCGTQPIHAGTRQAGGDGPRTPRRPRMLMTVLGHGGANPMDGPAPCPNLEHKLGWT
jgi:hypothetical protein